MATIDTDKFILLHTRLSGYWMACLEQFVNQTLNTEIHIFIKRPTAEAPFVFGQRPRIFIHEESSFTENELRHFLNELKPQIIYVAGWANKKYISVIKGFRRNIPVIMGLDNHWKGTIVQMVGAFYFRMVRKDRFTHIWIPGIPQYPFALMLGFKSQNILTGLYAADVDAFGKTEIDGWYHQPFPRKFLFVGRLVEHKGIDVLLNAISELNSEVTSPWNMEIVGSGKYEKQVAGTKGITYHAFIQPEQLRGLMQRGGVFVLPARYEAWGVVLHEAVAAGFPVVASHATGAATAFVRNGYNGFLCTPGNKENLKKTLRKIMVLTDQELWTMSQRSVSLSRLYTPLTWAKNIMELINEK